MMASDNILTPADGHTVTRPSQDMLRGLYSLSTVVDGAKGQGRVFSSLDVAQMARDQHEIDMQAKGLIRMPVDYPFINEQAPKGKLSKIVDDIATRYSTQQVAATLDALKDLGFTRAPWSGVTMAFSDIVAPPSPARRGPA